MNKSPKQGEMGNYLKKYQISLAGPLETKVVENKFSTSVTKVAKG